MAVISWTSEGMVWEENKYLQEISPEYFAALILAMEERWWVRYASKPDGEARDFQTAYPLLYDYARNYKYLDEFEPYLFSLMDDALYNLVRDGASANDTRTWVAYLDNGGDWDGLSITNIPVIKDDLSTYDYEVPYRLLTPALETVDWSWYWKKYNCLNHCRWFKINVSPDADSGWGIVDDPFATALSGFNALGAKNGVTPTGGIVWDVLNNDPSTNSHLKQSSRVGVYSFQTPSLTPDFNYNRYTYETYRVTSRGLDNTKVTDDLTMYSNITNDIRNQFGKIDWSTANSNAVQTFITDKLTANGADLSTGKVELQAFGRSYQIVNQFDVPGGFNFKDW